MYHRIMLGCAINIMILNANRMWGSAAVPEGTPGFIGARGTTETCTAQGFLSTLGFVVPSYYVALSVLCFLAVRNKFKVEKYQWIEKYIHVGAYVLPLSTGCYLLSVEGYNPSISECYLGSYPVGCGDESPDGIECERGPSNMAQLIRIFVGTMLGSILLIPLCLLGVTFVRVRVFEGRSGHAIASSVAQQSCIYLLALYWSYIFRFIFTAVAFKADSYVFSLHVLSKTMDALQGVWISMAYYYFRSDPTDIAVSPSKKGRSEASSDATEFLPTPPVSSQPLTLKKTTHFSIFDGGADSDPDSPWAQYLLDEGEDEEYKQDCGEYDDGAYDMEGQ